MSEYIIAVDEFDAEIGAVEKLEAHYRGVLHRAFSILVFNSSNQLLLQKRSVIKYHSPGLWTNTCCSHPRYGENLEDAAYRRIKEEMGFTCEIKEIFSFVYKVEFEDNLFEHEYDHVFIGRYDGQVIPNKDEVDEFKWIDMSELKNDIKEKPELYTYWFKKLFDAEKNELYRYLNS